MHISWFWSTTFKLNRNDTHPVSFLPFGCNLNSLCATTSLLKIPLFTVQGKVPTSLHLCSLRGPLLFFLSFLLHLFFILLSLSFLSFNPLLSSTASFTDYNPVCARSPVRTHTPRAESAASVSPLSNTGKGGREGWLEGEKKGERWRKEKQRNKRRGVETTEGLPLFSVHSEHV